VIGDRVKIRFKLHNGGHEWFPGKVTELRTSPKAKYRFHVAFDDGDKQWVAQDEDFQYEELALFISIRTGEMIGSGCLSHDGTLFPTGF